VLEDSDVRALNERALTEEEAEQRKAIHDYEDVAEEGGVAAFDVVALGEGRRTLSWIWYTSRADDPSEAELVEGTYGNRRHSAVTHVNFSSARRVV
jgi:hypothetical protein